MTDTTAEKAREQPEAAIDWLGVLVANAKRKPGTPVILPRKLT